MGTTYLTISKIKNLISFYYKSLLYQTNNNVLDQLFHSKYDRKTHSQNRVEI